MTVQSNNLIRHTINYLSIENQCEWSPQNRCLLKQLIDCMQNSQQSIHNIHIFQKWMGKSGHSMRNLHTYLWLNFENFRCKSINIEFNVLSCTTYELICAVWVVVDCCFCQIELKSEITLILWENVQNWNQWYFQLLENC